MLITPQRLLGEPSTAAWERQGGFALRRFADFGAAQSLREEWDQLASRVGGDLFNTFDWCATWWEHFGHDRALQLFAAFRDDQLVAAWPLFRETLHWGPIGLRVIRVVGCDHGVTTCNVLTEPHACDQVAQAVLAQLTQDQPWDLFHIGEIPGYAENAGVLAASLRGCAGVERVDLEEDVYPQAVFDVPVDYEAYLAGLSLKERRNVRKDERELAAQGGFHHQPASVSDVQQAFDALVNLHKKQWAVRGRQGHFADVPGVEAFHREIAAKALERGRLAMVHVRADGQTIASEYALQFNKRVHWIIGGRKEDVSSRIGFCALMRNAIQGGAELIDGLPGAYDYKRRLGGRSVSVKMIWAFSQTCDKRRFLAFRAITQAMSLAYHRAWFWHAAPALMMRAPHLGRLLIRPGLWERFARTRFLVVGSHAEQKRQAAVSNATGSEHDESVKVFEKAAKLQHAIYSSFEQLCEIRDEWDRFVADNDGDLYSSFDWCRIWWRHYGGDRNLEIHIYREDGEIVGIIPCFREKRFNVRLIRLLGCDHSTTTCGLVIAENQLESVVREFSEWLSQQADWDMVSWSFLAGYFVHRQRIATVLSRQPAWTVESGADHGPHIVWDLPATFDDYLASLAKKERSNIKIARKRAAEGSLVEDFAATPQELEKWFPVFIEQHQKQWEAEGKLGHFADWPRAVEFHTELARSLGAAGRLWLLRLEVGGQAVGFQYNYRFGKRIHWLLGARDVDAKWDPYSPGRVLHAQTIQRSIEDGYREIDGLRGLYEYKLRLGGTVRGLQSLTIIRRGLLSQLKVRFAKVIAQLFDLLYYRIWFSRIAPKLPFGRRGLWKSWIRTRF